MRGGGGRMRGGVWISDIWCIGAGDVMMSDL
jgi:hypothetical protein